MPYNDEQNGHGEPRHQGFSGKKRSIRGTFTPMKTTRLISLATTGLLLAGTAQAITYNVASGSIGNVRHIGGSLIPEINDYQPHNASGLDPANPANWTLMVTSTPGSGFGGWDPNNPTVDPTRGGASAAIAGGGISSVTVVGGVVTAATLTMAAGELLRYAHFQSCTPSGGPPFTSCVITDLVAQNLSWTYNSVNNTLMHQADPYTESPNHVNPTKTAFCTPAGGVAFNGGPTGTGITGQCGVLRGAVSNSTGLSFWNWDGMAANYHVIDSQMALYHAGTGLVLNIGGASGHAGVIWDLSGFVEGVGGVIKAHVVAGAVGTSTSTTAPGNNTGVAATYTLNVVPVPAAVWMLGGALGLLGFVRRWSKAAV
jgi:hypothetical protein